MQSAPLDPVTPSSPAYASFYGPAWADALVSLILTYSRDADTGGVALTLVDVCPHHAADARLLRQRLQALQHALPGEVRYISWTPDPEGEGAIADSWSVGAPSGTPRPATGLPAGGPPPWADEASRCDTPVLVLASDGWRQFKQHLLAVHYGKLFERPLDVGASATWSPVEAASCPSWVVDSLATYLPILNSAKFTVPAGAWVVLQKLLRWAHAGCLVVGRAPGWANERDLRIHRAADLGWDGKTAGTLPVNFHWLGRQLATVGAHTWQAVLDGDGHEAVQLALAGPGASPARLAALAQGWPLQRLPQPLSVARAVQTLCRAGDAAAALNVLMQAGCDVRVFNAGWPELEEALQRAGAKAPRLPPLLLQQAWHNHPQPEVDEHFLRGLVRLGFRARELAWVRRSLDALAALGRETAPDCLDHAHYLELAGDAPAAQRKCDEALAQQPPPEGAQTLRDRLAQRLTARDAFWRKPHALPSTPLRLEPLDSYHAPQLGEQYRDPQIAIMTALPNLSGPAAAGQWIATRVRESPASYAVIHPDFGFVGYCDLLVWQTTAFFSFWMGVDFQGRGFARQVLDLLLSRAFANGIKIVLSSAFDDNARSLRSLTGAGFVRMAVRSLPPNHDRTFIYLTQKPGTVSEHEATVALAEFCTQLQTGLRFPPIAAPADAPLDPAHGASSARSASNPGESSPSVARV